MIDLTITIKVKDKEYTELFLALFSSRIWEVSHFKGDIRAFTHFVPDEDVAIIMNQVKAIGHYSSCKLDVTMY